MITDLIADKANRCLPAGFRAAAQFPLPWMDGNGDWQPPSDAIALQVRNDDACVHVFIREADEALSDSDFTQRVITPILSAFEQSQNEICP